MGLLDHNRTWRIATNASPADCVRVFADCLNGRNASLLGSRWRVSTSEAKSGRRTAVAFYEGRTGVVGLMSAMSQRASAEQDAARGSELTFTATPGRDGSTTCTMEMTQVTKVYLVFTADARFFRSAMRRVARRLRDLDAGLEVVKQ
ncbi:hypothetical protein GCM10010399_34050 [Dactylosporangium fulvum]|uniref:Polyketide cyclase / dehydrase and lipid transport n=1 Tax=Dactylosporangium fulvum TaxID=53359 RepID=A0ABY5W385_9ACTN|nr:hypothetical protein [Dactylosporangium fulvum]UWP83188.1 hypothetical protein Dfulv_02440 [Dactylosporangium fulvum]